MQKKWKALLVAAVVVLTLSIGSGIALAQKSSVPATQAAQTDADAGAWCGGNGNGYRFDQVTLGRIATLLGTTTDQLQTQFNNGQTLAAIASASGVSSDKLIDTILAPEQEHLAINVKYGYLTQQQADQILSQARSRLSTVITQQATAGTTGAARRQGPGNGGMMGGGYGSNTGNGGFGGMMGGGYGGMMGGGMMGAGYGGMMGY